MKQQPTTVEGTLTQLRTVHSALMISVALYVVVMHSVPPQQGASPSSTLLNALALLGVANLGCGYWIRSRKLRVAFEGLRAKQDDPKSLAY